MYRTLKTVALPEDGGVTRTYRAGLDIAIDTHDDELSALVEKLVAQGRLKLVHDVPGNTGDVLDGVLTKVELVPDGEKTLKDHTVPELVAIAKERGASEDSVKNLSKPKLLDVIERLTHVDD